MKLRVLICVCILILSAGCNNDPPQEPVLRAEGTSDPKKIEFVSDITVQSAADPVAVVETARGTFAFEIFEQKVPETSRNFIELVNNGFYTGLRFHQVEPGILVQTGDPTGVGTGGAAVSGVRLETHPDLHHAVPGIVGMARQKNDVNTATSQFYVTMSPQPQLDGQYAVFGIVVKGLDVVQQLVRGDKVVSIEIIRLVAE